MAPDRGQIRFGASGRKTYNIVALLLRRIDIDAAEMQKA
jgi:hypothetical protein